MWLCSPAHPCYIRSRLLCSPLPLLVAEKSGSQKPPVGWGCDVLPGRVLLACAKLWIFSLVNSLSSLSWVWELPTVRLPHRSPTVRIWTSEFSLICLFYTRQWHGSTINEMINMNLNSLHDTKVHSLVNVTVSFSHFFLGPTVLCWSLTLHLTLESTFHWCERATPLCFLDAPFPGSKLCCFHFSQTTLVTVSARSRCSS